MATWSNNPPTTLHQVDFIKQRQLSNGDNPINLFDLLIDDNFYEPMPMPRKSILGLFDGRMKLERSLHYYYTWVQFH